MEALLPCCVPESHLNLRCDRHMQSPYLVLLFILLAQGRALYIIAASVRAACPGA